MIGEAIRVARHAQGITQEDLADRAGVTQAALSRWENDLRKPDDDAIAALADALGVTAALLKSADRIPGAMAVDAHMRRRATAPATAWRRLEARLNMHRLHTRRLLHEMNLRAELSIPLLDPVDTSPSTAARVTRMQWRLPTGPVRHLVQWMESAGCLIIEEDFGTSRVDGLAQWVDGTPVILINSRMPTDRRRLTLAHELGHLVLHSEHMSPDTENEANEFAAEFLMPAEVIRPELRRLTLGRLQDLKRHWLVSMQALIERARSLRVLPPADRTRLYKQISARGWRTAEPVSDELPDEKPQLPQSIGEALAGRGLTAAEIATIAGYSTPTDDNPFQPAPRGLRVL